MATVPFCVPGSASLSCVAEPTSMKDSGGIGERLRLTRPESCIDSIGLSALSTYPFSLNCRPNGVSCGNW